MSLCLGRTSMPNHVKNRIIVEGNNASDVLDVIERYRYDAQIDDENIPPSRRRPPLAWPDFDKVIPMPDDIYRGDLPLTHPYGAHNWYDWSIANWGTKWNSYGHGIPQYTRGNPSRVVFEFDTAWNFPYPVIMEIARQNPHLRIIALFADEDTGYNCGRLVFENGEIESEEFPTGGSKDAYELAFLLRPHCAADFQYIDGEYQYIERDDY